MVANDDLINRVITTLLNVSGRKTTKGHALVTMEMLLRDLEKEYDFLKYIQIKDTRFIEEDNPISIMSDVNSVSSEEIAQAVQKILLKMNQRLGKDAGHFFFREISRNVGSEYVTTMRDLGVDLGLLQLEHEVRERRDQTLPVVELAHRLLTEAHRIRRIQQEIAPEIGALLVLLHVVPVALGVELPIHVPQLVTRHVLTMVGELDIEAVVRTLVLARHGPLHDHACHELQIRQPGDRRGIEILAHGQRPTPRRVPVSPRGGD